jgi:sRNA-binding carbon storage regulator CsrA
VRAMIVIQDAKRAIKDGKRAATSGVHVRALLVKNPEAMPTLKASSQVAKAKVMLPAHREIAGSSGLDLVIDGAMAEGHVSDQGHHSVIAHHVVNVRRLVIGLRVLIAHVLTGTDHPGTLKAEKNTPREHLGNVRLNALALGRDQDREPVKALVKGHASEQDPHQVTDGLTVKGAVSAIGHQEVNVRRAATVHHAVKDEVLVIAHHAAIVPKEVTVLREVIVHHVPKDAVLVIAHHAAIAPKEVTVLHEVIVHHAVKDEVSVIVRHAVIAPKEVTVLREVIVHHAVKDEALEIVRHAVIAPKEVTVLREATVHHAVKDAVLVTALHAAQNVPAASALIPEVHAAGPDPSTLDCVRLQPVRGTRAGTPSTVYGTGVPGVIQRPVTLHSE